MGPKSEWQAGPWRPWYPPVGDVLRAENGGGCPLTSNLLGFAAAIGQFARVCADQNERDHAQLVSAIAAGAVESLPG
jgi:hypothetical protein